MTSSRRQFLKTAGATVLGAGLSSCTLTRRTQEEMTLYVGTYTQRGSEGIYLARLNPQTGALRVEGVAARTENPSFLAVDPSGRYLYAVNETAEFDGRPGGGVSAFAIEPAGGELRPLNRQSSGGGHPCYAAVDRRGLNVLVANYSGGNVAVLPITADGRLRPASAVIQHEGSGANRERQEEPHAHCIVVDAELRNAVAADLGADALFVYRFDPVMGTLSPAGTPYKPKPGAGPRHFVFHPNGRHAYVINELDSTISLLSYDAASGALAEVQTVSTLPAGYTGANSCADLHVHPSGRFLYGSNRGHDSIAAYRIDDASGRLTLTQHESTQGKTPRNFAIDPTGRYLLAANQASDTIVVFSIDGDTGGLTPSSHSVEVPVPVCLRFVQENA